MTLYNSYSTYIRNRFGTRLQKLSIDAGFSCPNRPDGRETGGCIFCNNHAFNPSYCSPDKSITQQIEEGIEFHRHRYPGVQKYLAYFQPYSNTFAPIQTLKKLYGEAMEHPSITGIVIGTRPDCVDQDKLDYIASLQNENNFVAVEYGIESCYEQTLRLINRGHTFEQTRRAIEMTNERGIHCGAHIIIGLPGETREMILEQAKIINTLPINSLKLHQLQVIKGTPLADSLNDTAQNTLSENPVIKSFKNSNIQSSLENYITLVCDFLQRLRPDIMIERFAGEVPPRYQAFPSLSWYRKDGRLLRNEEIPQLIDSELKRRNSRQGSDLNTHTQ